MKSFTNKNLTDSGYTTHHSDGSTSKTHQNLTDSGYTTHHSDGSTSKTHQNLTDSGYTTHHSDGSTSKTYRNIMDDGYTTYHSDGSTTKTHKDLINDGYTSYNDGKKLTGIGSGLEDLGGLFGGVFILGFMVICSFVVLKGKVFWPILIIAASFFVASRLSKKIGESDAYLLINPVFLYGIQLFLRLAWRESDGYDFIIGMPGFLGGIVIEVVLGLYIFVGKIEEYDDRRNSNTFPMFIAFMLSFLAPISAIIEFPAEMFFYVIDSFLLFLTVIIVIVRYKREKQ